LARSTFLAAALPLALVFIRRTGSSLMAAMSALLSNLRAQHGLVLSIALMR
jgi:hypothetical protein